MDNDDHIAQIITQHQPPIGTKVKLEELEADQVTPEQQQQIVQQAINGGGSNNGGATPSANNSPQQAPQAAPAN